MRKKQTAEQIRMKKNALAKEYYREHSLAVRKKRKKRYQKNRQREIEYSREYYNKYRKHKQKVVK